MDSYGNRLNVVFCSFVACLGLAALGNHTSSYWFTASPQAFVQLAEVYDFTVNQHLQYDQANIALHITGDLSSVFNWNTKQLYTYVTAHYSTPKNRRNEVVVWDTILERPEDAVFSLRSELNKYPLRDNGRMLRDRNVTLALKYRYMPVVGLMREFNVTESHFIAPGEYFRRDVGSHHDYR